MAEAIVNFCAAVSNKDTIWGNNSKYSQAVQRWGLFEFLHRGCKDDEKGKRWVKFTNNNWRIEDWLTREAVQRRIRDKRQQELGREILEENQPERTERISYKKMLDKDLMLIYNNASRFEKQIIERSRPELFRKEMK